MPQTSVTKSQFLTVIWTLSGIALAFLVARLIIRLKVYGHLMVDDGLVILAMMCLVTVDVINTVILSKTYIVQSVQLNHSSKPSHYQAIADSYAKCEWAIAYLFFTGIWAVKGSFLAYYDDLTKRLTSFRRAWWVTIVFTILTYIGSLLAYAFLDGNHYKTSLRNEAIKYQFSADLSTDVFITVIPLVIALKSQIPSGQKLVLAGVFSLSLIITIFSIIRFSLNSPNRELAGPSWIQLWSIIEQSISVTVACLASFRVFVIDKRRKSKKSSSRGHGKDSSSSSSQKVRRPSVKLGFPDLRSHWGRPSVERRENGSMEFQLLDATSLRNPAQETARPKNVESTDVFNEVQE